MSRSAAEEIYRSVVIDHFRHPRNRQPLTDPDASVLADNPVCGDQVRVEIAVSDGCIQAVSARARGCSIAVAAASVMTELVQGLDARGAGALESALESLVHGRSVEVDLDERLRAFEKVADLPSRRRCALLAWEALRDALVLAESVRS